MSGDHNQYQKPAHAAQRQPEPVGWIYEDDEGRMIFSQMPHPDPLCEPVYRAAPKRKWVGLTKKETLELLEKNIDRPFSLLVAVRDKLKANNDR